MAKNWLMKEAANEIISGNKDAIVDIGRRFPLVSNAIAKMGNNEGAMIIINALPDYISVRKIEAVLKDGVQEIEDDEIVDPTEEKEEVVEEKPVEKKGRGRKKKEEPMNEPVEDAAEDEEPDLKKMSEVELFKLAKKKGLKPEPKKNKKYYIDLLTKSAEEADDEDDWDDEEPEEKPAKKEKAKKAPAKKEVEDEDDDWDI